MSGLYFPPVIVNGRINFPNPLFQTYGAPHQTVVWRPFMPGVVNPLGSNILYTGNMISPAIHNLRPIYGNSTSLGSNLHINLHSLTNPLPSSAVGLQASLFTCSPHVGMSLEMKKEVTGEKRKIEEDSEHRDRKKVKLETKALKAKRPGFTEERYNETSYYEDGGLRKVYPYYFTFTTFCKGRWVGQPILEIFAREFRAHPPEEYERCIKSGTLTVNYKTVDVDYKLQHNDLLANTVHRHEVPVATFPIEILHESDDLVVIDKPPSIPVHPCGRYRHNTVVFILAKEFNLKNLRTIHRLDRLTSGLLLFGRSLKKARQLEHEIRSRLVQKHYVCRVVGEFPSEPITCEEPIEVVSYKIGVCRVGPNGKECKTEFERLSYNGTTSVVLCKPHTGRMHQIRVHLQYLGFPITNDPLYNHTVFGPEKGKGGQMDKSNDELITELIRIHNAENWLGLDGEESDNFVLASKMETFTPLEDVESKTNQVEEVDPTTGTNSDSIIHIPAVENNSSLDLAVKEDEKPKRTLAALDTSKFVKDSNCYECKVKYRDPTPKDLVMFLHAWRYKGPDWEFETKLPKWASEDWKE